MSSVQIRYQLGFFFHAASLIVPVRAWTPQGSDFTTQVFDVTLLVEFRRMYADNGYALVRLIEGRLQVVSDSLQLIQDEVFSMTDVRGISDVVNDLLVKLEMNEQFRVYYTDVLKEGSPALPVWDRLSPMLKSTN